MKIILEDEDTRYEHVFNDNNDIHDIIDHMEYGLLALTFHPESVKRAFLAKAEEQYIKKKDD